MTRRNKPSTSQTLRPIPLIAMAMVMLLLASTLMAGAQSEGPETTELGSEGNEKYAVEYKDGSEVNTDCGTLQTTCAGAAAVVLDIEEDIIVMDMFGYEVARVTVGLSIAVAASAGYAKALPTGSVWMRGWGEAVGETFSEYHRNGFLESGEMDPNCFKAVPLQDAICSDQASALAGGGNCVRALAQVKASNGVDHAVSQQSKTELYAAAHTKDKCIAPDATADLMGIANGLITKEEEARNGSEETSQHYSIEGCSEVPFGDFPSEVRNNISDIVLTPAEETLNFSQNVDATFAGDKEEYIKLILANQIFDGVEEELSLHKFSVCPES